MRPSISWFLISLWRFVILAVATEMPVLYTVINGNFKPDFSKFLNMRLRSAMTTGTSNVSTVLFSASYDLVIRKFLNNDANMMFAMRSSLFQFRICMSIKTS